MLFGHQNDDATQPVAQADPVSDTSVNPLAVDPATGVSLPVAPTDSDSADTTEPEEPSVLNQPASSDSSTAPIIQPDSSALASDSNAADAYASDSSENDDTSLLGGGSNDSTDSSDDTVRPAPDDTAGPASDLLTMKQQAIAQLSPLVGQLDQTPEEKFRTTMMLIQSTDNQALLKEAYEAAQAISDEKAKAQALLDIVNEINYFTQPKS